MAAVSSSRVVAKQALSMVLVLALIVPTMITEFASAKAVHALAGDFNGDGVTTPGLFVDGLFILSGANHSGDTVRFHYGRPDDVPVVGDWTGDGIDTVGVVRRGRHWHLRFSNTGGVADRSFTYGGWLGRDRPVVGDWIGKGYDLPGIVRGSTWHLRNALAGGDADITFTYGRVGRGDHPVMADWNGNGVDTAGIVRDGRWHVKNTHSGGSADWTFFYGRADDVPVVGSWDGRRRDTPGVVRGTTWLLKNSLSAGPADIVLEFPDSTGDEEVEALRRPEESPSRGAPSKPAPEPEPEPAPEPEPVPSPETDDVQGELARTSIGSPEPAGNLSFNSGAYTLKGGGADIWKASDSFEFAHQTMEGDGKVVVRVNSQTPTHEWAKAGLMVRSDLTPGAQHVSVFQTPLHGAVLQYRSRPDANAVHVHGVSASSPSWLQLERKGDTFTARSSKDGLKWTLIGSVSVAMATVAFVGLAVTSHNDGTPSKAEFSDYQVGPATDGDSSEPSEHDAQAPEETMALIPSDGLRLLYSPEDIGRYHASMTTPGPYFATGDAGHGGPYSPNDGQRSTQLSRDFLRDPQASYWIQPDLPFAQNDPHPGDMVYVRPMHAAWVFMTQPDHPDREALRREVRALLLHHATHPSHDFANATNYPVTYPGFAPSPIFGHSAWMTRLIKARDMLGRDSFTHQENEALDQWFYDYSNWAFQWLHRQAYVKVFEHRERRDYSQISRRPDANRQSYDGGPLIGSLARAYTNRHAAVASTASLAANYLELHGFEAPTSGGPSYGRWSVDRLLLHSQLFVEETIRFSVYPEGIQGDFERGTQSKPQLGWMYSINVLANLVEMAEYHAKRGDFSVWAYGTTEGFDGTAGRPVAGAFSEKNLHFYAWSMSRYVNNGWNRTNYGEPLALPHFYHDVIPAATAARFAPDDRLLRDAWRRSGSNFPPYPQRPQSQGRWDARLGQGAKMIGLIEQADASSLR